MKIAQKQRPDLILSDFTMPGMTGPAFLSQIEKQKLASNAVKYIITGGMAFDKVPGKRDADLDITDGIITKPFEDQNLAKTSQKAIA